MKAFVAVVVLGGCSVAGGGASDEGEPPIGPLPDIADLRTFVLPLNSYRLLPSERLSTIGRAEQLLFQRCLARFGFDYKIHPPPDPDKWQGLARRYGVADEERAASWGYKGPPSDDEATYVEPSTDMVAVLTGRGPSSYNGMQVPEGGCVGQARRTLAEGTSMPANKRLGDQLSGESLERTYADSRVLKVLDDWSACMKRAGYDYANPMKANNDARWSESDIASPEEINTAVADVRCKKETNLINVMATVETAYQKRALERNAEALAAIKAAFEAQERNAAAIIAGQTVD